MEQKVKIGDKEYDLDQLSTGAKSAIASLQFTNRRIAELNSMRALMLRAKNSYIDSLKKELISNKAGLLLSDD